MFPGAMGRRRNCIHGSHTGLHPWVVGAVGTKIIQRGERMADEIQLVVFTLNAGDMTCEYGVPITQVQEIIRLTTPTRLPQVPAFVEGIINLRGDIIPIIDLKKRFNMPTDEYTDETRIIVVDIEGKTVGIIVDQVAEVLRLPEQCGTTPGGYWGTDCGIPHRGRKARGPFAHHARCDQGALRRRKKSAQQHVINHESALLIFQQGFYFNTN